MSTDVQKQIAQLLVRRCTNCYEELSGYNTKAWHWFAEGQVGPFCEHCWRLVVGPVINDPPVAAPTEIQTEPCPRCGTICPAGWCGVCHAPIIPLAAPPPHQHIDVEAMRSNLHATFGKGWDDSRDGRQAFHHGMDHVCNALAAWQRGESTNGILPDPWLSQGGWVALDRIDKLVQQLRADFGRERDRNQVLETELAALRTSRVAAPTPETPSQEDQRLSIRKADLLRFHMLLVAESASAHLTVHREVISRVGDAWEPIRLQVKALLQQDAPPLAGAVSHPQPEKRS